MTTVIRAIVEDGQIKPLEPLTLPEGTEVEIHAERVSATEDAPLTDAELHELLGDMIVQPVVTLEPMTDEEDAALERWIDERTEGVAPLSELVIENRE